MEIEWVSASRDALTLALSHHMRENEVNRQNYFCDELFWHFFGNCKTSLFSGSEIDFEDLF